jgi:hypothetical protein
MNRPTEQWNFTVEQTIKKEENLPADYLNSTTNGVIWGEGASFLW